MKRPTWGTAIGILMIIFGGCSVLNNFQAITIPSKMEEIKSKMSPSDLAAIDSISSASTDTLYTDDTTGEKNSKKAELEMVKNTVNMPEETVGWIVRFGYIGFLIAAIYILGGVFLLTPQPYSIKLAYVALVISIAFSATKTITLTAGGSAAGMIALTMGATQLFSIIIDVIMISVVFASDKEFYNT